MPVVVYISPECPIMIISLTFTDLEWYRTIRQHRRHHIYNNPPLRATWRKSYHGPRVASDYHGLPEGVIET